MPQGVTAVRATSACLLVLGAGATSRLISHGSRSDVSTPASPLEQTSTGTQLLKAPGHPAPPALGQGSPGPFRKCRQEICPTPSHALFALQGGVAEPIKFHSGVL